MNIIGISAFFHDSACCILQNGRLVAAASEERFSRIKQDPDLPIQAFRFCLRKARISIREIDGIAFYEQPDVKKSRQIWANSFSLSPSTFFRDRNWVESQIRDRLGYEGAICFFEHHQSHAASAFYYAGFEEAAIFTADGVGEWATSTYGIGQSGQLNLFEEVAFPHSLGLLYSTITAYLGFQVNRGEYKVMGLAAYGKTQYVDQVRQMIQEGEKGQFRLDMRFFDFLKGDRMYSDDLIDCFGIPPRKADSEILPVHQDIAKSLQIVLEEVLLDKVHYLYNETRLAALCMAGGVALNCVANARIRKHGPFNKIFIQPAAGDAGGCLGAAALAHQQFGSTTFHSKDRFSVYLGPKWSDQEMYQWLQYAGIEVIDYRNQKTELLEQLAQELVGGKIIGWFQGRMEFGPRALGNRSILANPMLPDMQDRLNRIIKKREDFRPFAPTVLAAHMRPHFDLEEESPFMLETAQLNSSLDLPAIKHIDGSARPQTLQRDQNPLFYDLIHHFYLLTDCPMLLNTSFNQRGEPIVCHPSDAVKMGIITELDFIVLGHFLIDCKRLPSELRNLQKHFEPVLPNSDTTAPNIYTFV